jgi:CRISPR/Cas system-associated endonuclease Cas3-HD
VLLFKQEEDIQIEQIKRDVQNKDNKEVLEWVRENAKGFRDYLERIENIARKYKDRLGAMHELLVEIDELEEEME